MVITKELLLGRRKRYEAERDQHLYNFNAAHGAIQDIDYWLEMLEADDRVADESGMASSASSSSHPGIQVS